MKSNLKFILIGFVIFVIGIICFTFELKNFNQSRGLTSNFEIKQEVIKYPITNDQNFRITNENTNNNINLYIDNNLSNEVKIIVNYPNISKLKYDYSVINDDINLVSINFESTTLLDFDSIKDIYELGLISFRDKVVYNYSLLEQPEIKVFVNEKYRKNIEFVGNYGKVYNPIR